MMNRVLFYYLLFLSEPRMVNDIIGMEGQWQKLLTSLLSSEVSDYLFPSHAICRTISNT